MSIDAPRRGWSPIPDTPDQKPWYRQVWPWVLIGLPLASVIAGFSTLFIAMDDPDGLVQDDYYQAGVAIQVLKDRQQLAADMGLAGRLVVPSAGGELSFKFDGNAPADVPELTLSLRHATRSQHDVVARLRGTGDGHYAAVIDTPLAPGNWNITLVPPDEAWRIRGRGFTTREGQSALQVELAP